MIEGNAARKASLRFKWRTSPSGNQWLRLTRSEAVTVYYWKTRKCWSYWCDADGKKIYRNDFETQLEAMLAAEEDWGDRVADQQETPTRRSSANLTVVRSQDRPVVEPEPEPEVEVEDRQVDEKITNPEPPSATRSPKDYLTAYFGNDQTPWGRVLHHSAGERKPIRIVAVRADLSVDETTKYLKSYDRDLVEVEIRGDEVKVTWTEKFYSLSAEASA